MSKHKKKIRVKLTIHYPDKPRDIFERVFWHNVTVRKAVEDCIGRHYVQIRENNSNGETHAIGIDSFIKDGMNLEVIIEKETIQPKI